MAEFVGKAERCATSQESGTPEAETTYRLGAHSRYDANNHQPEMWTGSGIGVETYETN